MLSSTKPVSNNNIGNHATNQDQEGNLMNNSNKSNNDTNGNNAENHNAPERDASLRERIRASINAARRNAGREEVECDDRPRFTLEQDRNVLKFQVTQTTPTREVVLLKAAIEVSGAFTIPASVTYENEEYAVVSIGMLAFLNNREITSVTIPATAVQIGGGAFAGCSQLATFEVEEGNSNYKAIDGVLYDYAETELVCVPGTQSGEFLINDCVQVINGSAFSACAGLTSVVLGAAVAQIGSRTFSSCSALNRIEVVAENTHFKSVDGVLFNHSATELISVPCGRNGEYTVPDSVSEIADHAFDRCRGLTSVALPTNVAKIGRSPFSVCTSLKRLDVADDNTHYKSVDGVLYNKSMSELIYFPSGCGGDFTVPSGVQKIASGAFAGSDITSVTIPDGVASIASGTFAGCSSLESVVIGTGVKQIEMLAFLNCKNLEAVTYWGTEQPAISESAFRKRGDEPFGKLYLPNATAGFDPEAWGVTEIEYGRISMHERIQLSIRKAREERNRQALADTPAETEYDRATELRESIRAKIRAARAERATETATYYELIDKLAEAISLARKLKP